MFYQRLSGTLGSCRWRYHWRHGATDRFLSLVGAGPADAELVQVPAVCNSLSGIVGYLYKFFQDEHKRAIVHQGLSLSLSNSVTRSRASHLGARSQVRFQRQAIAKAHAPVWCVAFILVAYSHGDTGRKRIIVFLLQMHSASLPLCFSGMRTTHPLSLWSHPFLMSARSVWTSASPTHLISLPLGACVHPVNHPFVCLYV